MSYISSLDNIDDHVEYSEYSECTVYATVINGLTPWCRRPPFQGGAAGKGQNGPHVQ